MGLEVVSCRPGTIFSAPAPVRLISDMKSKTKKKSYSDEVLEILSDMNRQRTVHTQRRDLEPSHIALLKYDATPSEWPNLLDSLRLPHHKQRFI